MKEKKTTISERVNKIQGKVAEQIKIRKTSKTTKDTSLEKAWDDWNDWNIRNWGDWDYDANAASE